MKIEIIRERETFYLRIFSIIILVGGFLYWFASNNVFSIVIPVIQILPLILSPIYLYKNIGEMELKVDEVIIYPKDGVVTKIPVNNELRMKLFLDERSNESYKRFVTKGFLIRLQIEAGNELFNEYKLLIKKEQREELISILKQFYANGIKIKERDSLGAKYFLLKGNLSFNKIQEIKAEYDLTW